MICTKSELLWLHSFIWKTRMKTCNLYHYRMLKCHSFPSIFKHGKYAENERKKTSPNIAFTQILKSCCTVWNLIKCKNLCVSGHSFLVWETQALLELQLKSVNCFWQVWTHSNHTCFLGYLLNTASWSQKTTLTLIFSCLFNFTGSMQHMDEEKKGLWKTLMKRFSSKSPEDGPEKAPEK